VSLEFIDTNILVYAYERDAGEKHERALELLSRLYAERTGALSIQVMAEFYAAATLKLRMSSRVAEEILAELAIYVIHSPAHPDVLRAVRLQRRYKTSWWDALILSSALDLECSVLWTEDMTHRQRFGSLTMLNPFL
jgi:predicted nucleic acid-binding protein